MGRIEERRVQHGGAALAARAAQFSRIQCEGRIAGPWLHFVFLQTVTRVATKRACPAGWASPATESRRSVRACVSTQECRQRRCDSRCAEHECRIKDGEVRSRCRRNQGEFCETLDCGPREWPRVNAA